MHYDFEISFHLPLDEGVKAVQVVKRLKRLKRQADGVFATEAHVCHPRQS